MVLSEFLFGAGVFVLAISGVIVMAEYISRYNKRNKEINKD